MHLDVARNFQSKATVLKFLDLMAFYKLNRFHFHLSDDEGWRIEIQRLPELTEIGGRRGHTLDQSDRLIPTHGSGPFPDRSPGSGFYTRADFVEILQYARDRHIEVIPELDFPGHAHSAIQSMEVRYRRLSELGDEQAASEFRLIDPEDRSEHRSVQGWGRNVINVCQDSTYHFLEPAVADLVDTYHSAGLKLKTLHVGGDEVPQGVWERSPACEELYLNNEAVAEPEDLPDYFLSRSHEILSRHGLVTAGWEEIALTRSKVDGRVAVGPNPRFVSSGFLPYFWNSVPTWGGEENGYRLANAGYDVVLCNASNLYFDLAYNKDPEENGLHWAGFVDTRKAWDFVPLDVYQSNDHDVMGNPLTSANSSFTALTEAGRSHVLGIQGQLWGESLNSPARLEFMAFPKLLALAERAWSAEPAWAREPSAARRLDSKEADWNRFANELGQVQLPRLDYLAGGVGYRIPPPGARIRNGLLEANIDFPGLTIRYTTDGSEPSPASPEYREPVSVSGLDSVRVRAFDRLGRGSRVVALEEVSRALPPQDRTQPREPEA
jgi:hexosaminidase